MTTNDINPALSEFYETHDKLQQYYFKFRYDFVEDETDEDVIRTVCGVPLGTPTYMAMYPGTVGVENHNAYGDEIKRHMHYHFVLSIRPSGFNKKKREIVNRVVHKLKAGRTAGWYSLKEELKIRDFERFHSYTFKQYSGVYEKPDWCHLPEGLDLAKAVVSSSEEYERNKEFLLAKRAKNDRKQTTYERLLVSYHEKNPTLRTRREAFYFVDDFFDNEGFPPERSKMLSCLDGLCRKAGLMTADEFFDAYMK